MKIFKGVIAILIALGLVGLGCWYGFVSDIPPLLYICLWLLCLVLTVACFIVVLLVLFILIKWVKEMFEDIESRLE